MADKEGTPATKEVSGSPSQAAAAVKNTVGKPRTIKPSNPSTVDMIHAAVGALNERGGSSLQAIKKYMAGTYNLDTERTAIFIRKHIKAAVLAGTLIQTKGKGASGSFKLPVGKTDASKKKKTARKPVATKKAEGTRTMKKATTTKSAETTGRAKKVPAKNATKKPVIAEKAKKAAAPAKSGAAKSPSKVKKAAKAPTTKPKAPKPKKIAGPKTVAKKPAAAKK